MAVQTYISELTWTDRSANRVMSCKLPKPTEADDPCSFFISILPAKLSEFAEKAGAKAKLDAALAADIPFILWNEEGVDLFGDGTCWISATHKPLP